MQDVGIENEDDTLQQEARYLLFRLGGELYGTPLLGVREIVEPKAIKPIPNAVPCFLGVMNLRGQIISVLDLRRRLGLDDTRGPENALMVFDTGAGSVAALVNKVEAVTAIPDTSIERAPIVTTQVPLKYFLGIGRIGEELATLIELSSLLSAEELLGLHREEGEGK